MHVKIMHEKTIKTKKVVSLKRHIQSHKELKESITCDQCSKTVTRRDNYWKHRERIHRLQNVNIEAIMEKEDNKCNMCKKEFENKDLFITCMSLRACFSEFDTQERFKCQLCDKSFIYKSALNRRKKTIHDEKNKLLKCKICDRVFPYKTPFTRHLKDQH